MHRSRGKRDVWSARNEVVAHNQSSHLPIPCGRWAGHDSSDGWWEKTWPYGSDNRRSAAPSDQVWVWHTWTEHLTRLFLAADHYSHTETDESVQRKGIVLLHLLAKTQNVLARYEQTLIKCLFKVIWSLKLLKMLFIHFFFFLKRFSLTVRKRFWNCCFFTYHPCCGKLSLASLYIYITT